MNKRITSLALVFVMVLSLLVTAVPALAAPIESTQLKVTADKTSAKPGDTITYTITMGPVSDMGSMQMCLDIPTGLTYVENSTELADGLKATLGFDDVAWTEISKMINGVASAADYESNTDTVIAKFQCTVDADFSGTAEVGLTNLEFGSCQTFEYHTDRFSVVKASVTVTTPHTHVYDQTSTDAAHLKTPATCTEAAVYYKSCTCGENGEETFTSGSALGHDYTKEVENNTYLKTAASNCTEYNVYWYACSRCDANAKDDAEATDKYYTSTTAGNHSFTEKIEDAAHYVTGTGTDCRSVKKYYFDCAYCNQIGTTTWDSITYGPHNYAATWSSDADGHWHECSLCHDKKDNAAHTPGAVATETTPQKCTKCDYIITPALGHTHSLTPVAAKPATCTTDGNKAYYVCSGCSKWYEDATGNVEITDHSSVVIGHPGHDWADATCTAPKTCKRCDTTEGTALGHSYSTELKKDASQHWHECSRCHDKKDIADHDYGTDKTCDICGYTKSSGGGYIPTIQKPTIEAGEGVKVTLSTDGTVATITVEAGYELADVVLNGTSKGKVTEVKGLKTGDKLAVTATKKATEPTKEDILATLADQKLVARSKVVTMKNGKKAVRITWYNQNGEMMEFDGVQIFRSVKKNSGYGKKPIFTSETDKYYNTAVKVGTKYYYKVRGFVVIDGQKYYTDWSLKAWRTVK